MSRYPVKRKESVLKKLLPPHNRTVAEVAREEGITAQTIYNWRSKALSEGRPMPGKSNSEDWSAETKLAVIVETMPLSESELSEYCRQKGLFPEQIKSWKEDALTGFVSSREQKKQTKQQAKADKVEIKNLKRELRIKEKALAETAALLVLRKKLNAFWSNSEEED